MTRALKNGMILSGALVMLCVLASCTTANLGDDIKAEKTPAPAAVKSETDVAPLNETDTVTALLQAAATLRPDTVDAAQHDVLASKIPYIGAWAADEAGCGNIDQGPYENFAIITTKSFRNSTEVCAINAVAPEENPTTIEAICGSTAKEITLLVTAIGGLQIVSKTDAAPVEYMRCQLPK